MTHDAAVRTVVKLVPDMEKRGAAAVLREYAAKEDLPPAQLEKLAQVYNTLRTVSHIDKSADRGSSVDLVDVPDLVVGYALDMGHEKKALAPAGFQSHSPAQVDLMSAMRAEIAGPKAARPMAKVAAAPVKTIKESDLRDAASELAAEARLDMAKLAGDILRGIPFADGYYDLSGIERDAIHSRGTESVKSACDWLDKSIHLSRRQSHRHDYDAPLAKQAFAVGSPLSAALIDLADAVCMCALMEKIASTGPFDPSNEPANAAHTATAGGADLASELAAMSPEDRVKVMDLLAQQGINIEPELPEAPEETGESRASRSVSPSSSGGPPPSGGGAGKATSAPPAKAQGGGTAGKLWGAATAPIRAAGDVAINASNKANDLLTSITSKERSNKSQRNADLSVEDVRRAINIRRMIGTDAVLKEADPREVLEIYNSVARLNPEIAHNMPAMKLLLREAVSYEGLTLDAQKQLTDIRKGTGESEAKEYDNDKRRYAVGGAPPIGTSRKA